MPFGNPVAGASGTLVRNQFKSQDFLTGVRGWAIFRNGNAEFNAVTIRGSVIVGPNPGAHIIVDSVTGAILVYNSSNQLIASVSPSNQVIGGVNVLSGIQLYRATDSNIYARMFDDQVTFADTTTIPTSTPGGISNANQSNNGGNTFLRLTSGVTGAKNSAQFFAVGETGDGVFPAYLAALQQTAPGVASTAGQVVQTDTQAHGSPAFVHMGSYTFNTDAAGTSTFNHGCGFTPVGGILFPLQTASGVYGFAQWFTNPFTSTTCHANFNTNLGLPYASINGVGAFGIFWK